MVMEKIKYKKLGKKKKEVGGFKGLNVNTY